MKYSFFLTFKVSIKLIFIFITLLEEYLNKEKSKLTQFLKTIIYNKLDFNAYY